MAGKRVLAFEVNTAACISCGLCQSIAPALFTVVGAAPAAILDLPRGPAEVEAAWEAAEACPTAAILVRAVILPEKEGVHVADPA